MDQFVSDILEFVHGIMEDTSDVERVEHSFVAQSEKSSSSSPSSSPPAAASSAAGSDPVSWSNNLTCISEQLKRTCPSDSCTCHVDNKWFDVTELGDIVIKKEIDSTSNSSWLGYVISVLFWCVHLHACLLHDMPGWFLFGFFRYHC